MKDIEVRHCRVLLAVADSRGVGAAARRLGVAQSTVSETLLSLERALGAAMTVRRPGMEATLTPAAMTLLPHARAIVAASEAAQAAFGAAHRTVRIGAIESVSSFLLPGVLADLHDRCPELLLDVSTSVCEDLIRRVAAGDLQAALVVERPTASLPPGVARRPLAPWRLQLFSAAPPPVKRSAPAALSGLRLLTPDPGGPIHETLDHWAGAGAALRLESAGSVEGVKRGAVMPGAAGLLPDYAIADDVAAGDLWVWPLDPPLPPLQLSLLAPATGVAAALPDLAQSLARALAILRGEAADAGVTAPLEAARARSTASRGD